MLLFIKAGNIKQTRNSFVGELGAGENKKQKGNPISL